MRIEIAMTKMKDMYDLMHTVIEYIKDCGVTQCLIHKTPLSYIALPEHDLIIYFRIASLDKIRGLRGDYYYTDSYECDEYLKYTFTKEIREIIELKSIIADRIKKTNDIPNICKNCTGNPVYILRDCESCRQHIIDEERDRIMSIITRCIAHNVYNVLEGKALLDELKEEIEKGATNNSFINGVIYAADKFVQKLHEYNSEKYFDCLTDEDILKLRNDIIEEVKE